VTEKALRFSFCGCWLTARITDQMQEAEKHRIVAQGEPFRKLRPAARQPDLLL